MDPFMVGASSLRLRAGAGRQAEQQGAGQQAGQANALILKAKMPEVRICVDPSCCAGVTPQSHDNALKAMQVCQIEIL